MLKLEDRNTEPVFPNNYIQDRLLPQIKLYAKESKYLRREYYIISTLNTIVLAAVPLLTMLSDTYPFLKYCLAGSSALASVFSGTLLLRRTKDNWLEYQATSDALMSELARFTVENPGYIRDGATLDDSAHFNREFRREYLHFVNTCENIMKTERSGWYLRMKAESDQKSTKEHLEDHESSTSKSESSLTSTK